MFRVVLDQIYSDPDSLRELALGLEFTSRARNFPGSRSTRTIIPEEIEEAFSSILGLRIGDAKNRIPYNGCFQIMRASDRKKSYVHADFAARWAALVYLSPKLEPAGGTSFFQHKETGLIRYPQAKELQQIIQKDWRRPSKWIEIDRIGFAYNRFVLYDALLFHRNGKTWGSALSTARLTHNFFI